MTGRAPRVAPIFYAGAVLAVAGAVVAIVGSQLPWEREITPGRTVRSEEGTFRFPDETQAFDADDVGASTTLLAAGLAGATVLPLLTGPRLRPWLYGVVIVLGAVVALSTRGGAAMPGWEPGPGRMVAMVGGLVVLASALVAIGPSSGVPRIGIPERPPETPAGD